jgi:hypothetical protein
MKLSNRNRKLIQIVVSSQRVLDQLDHILVDRLSSEEKKNWEESRKNVQDMMDGCYSSMGLFTRFITKMIIKNQRRNT